MRISSTIPFDISPSVHGFEFQCYIKTESKSMIFRRETSLVIFAAIHFQSVYFPVNTTAQLSLFSSHPLHSVPYLREEIVSVYGVKKKTFPPLSTKKNPEQRDKTGRSLKEVWSRLIQILIIFHQFQMMKIKYVTIRAVLS